jgi:hypothetical protein
MKKQGIYNALLNEVQSELSQFFKNNLYKKYNRAYNKLQEDGLIHVISFQLGEYPIGNYIIPGLRESLYGKFAINLGVYIPYIDHFEKHYNINMKSGVKDYHCEIRKRLKENPNEQNDYWINLSDDIFKIKNHVQNLIENKGIPFLDQFQSINDIICYYDTHGEIPFNNSERSMFSVALIYYGMGNIKKFDEYSNNIITKCPHKGFVEHVKEVYNKLMNTDLLINKVRTNGT